MSRGNAYPDTRISLAEQAALRPEVARLAGLGRTYAQIAQALSTSLCPLNGRKVRAIQVRFGIPAGGPNGRPRGVPDRAGDASGNAARIAAAAAARAKVRPIVEAWTAERFTDRQMADRLNEMGVPPLGGIGLWTATRMESFRRREGIVSLNRNTIQQRFIVPEGCDAHCNTCDAPVDFDWRGNAVVHARLTRMVIAGVVQTGRCEGSSEPVVARPIPARTLGAAA